MHHRAYRIKLKSEAGGTLVEALVASLLLMTGVLAIGHTFVMTSSAFLLAERQRSAEAQVGSLTVQLASLPRERITASGSDYIVVPTPGNEGQAPTFPPDCERWPCSITNETPPGGTKTLFKRQWRVDSVDQSRNLMEITVEVFDYSQPEKALVSRTTKIIPQ